MYPDKIMELPHTLFVRQTAESLSDIRGKVRKLAKAVADYRTEKQEPWEDSIVIAARNMWGCKQLTLLDGLKAYPAQVSGRRVRYIDASTGKHNEPRTYEGIVAIPWDGDLYNQLEQISAVLDSAGEQLANIEIKTGGGKGFIRLLAKHFAPACAAFAAEAKSSTGDSDAND